MFPTFNGSSRKRRDINLGGRKSTPSTSRGSLPTRTPAPSTSVLNAQRERAQREAERRRLKAATTVQRVWRGRRVAEAQREAWRREWDEKFAGGNRVGWVRWDDPGKGIEEGLTLFLAFYERGLSARRDRKRDIRDLGRMNTLVLYMVQRAAQGPGEPSLRNVTRGEGGRTNLLLREFSRLLLEVLGNKVIVDDALKLLPLLAISLPDIVDANYYRALSQVTASNSSPEAILRAVLTPLHLKGKVGEKRYAEIYRYYAANYLVTPGLPDHLGRDSFELLRAGVEAGKLVKAMAEYPETWTAVPTEERLWMLSYIIHFFLKVSGRKVSIDLTSDNKPLTDTEIEERSYIQVLLLLLSSVAAEAGSRIDVEDVPMEIGNGNEDEDDDPRGGESSSTTKQPLPPFVKSELNSLVEQSSVNSIFSHASFFARDDGHAQVLSGFALTLLMVFPSRKEEICMWLCLAETSDGVFAVKYLWEAVKRTHLFQAIVKDFSVAADSLRKRNSSASSAGPLAYASGDDDEWNLILLFVELYGFLLLVMDDDEFFAGGEGEGKARQLPLKEVGDMSVFLKNLAFAMYWSGGDKTGEDKRRHDGGEVFLRDQGTQAWDLVHLRGAATSLLRMIYTRDSRRRFLPKGHWLMTTHFDIESLIPAVVQEEENRHRLENDDLDDAEEPERPYDVAAIAALSAHERRNIRLERMARDHRRQQRNHYLAAITPRLEILQNLPFFIPFATRVQIFREFVAVDQGRRRGGFVDPDQWRAAVLSRSSHLPGPTQGALGDSRDNLNRHHATIRRNKTFEDAYEQFWQLGEGLKEPIQITFVDKFGAEEAGIDGGGVTKEFLTSVCGDAFTPSVGVDGDEEVTELVELSDEEDDGGDEGGDGGDDDVVRGFGKNLFLENGQRLLYPNPTSIEELKEEVRRRGPPRPPMEKEVKGLLKRYEFLGRIVGKCLYEGILVDVAFAPFFLLKWSQQASDPKASSAVGVNDLRHLDEGLYRGLVNLKNYTGDVEFDLGLNFTISSRLPMHEKTITVDLKPSGEKIPVTNANKLEYIHLVSKYRLSVQAYQQTSAFLRGLNSIINPNWLSMFNQSELQTLVGGDINTPIDVEDLRRNTVYGGIYQVGSDGVEHESVQLFWQVMRGLDDDERRKVLKFVTSVARAPLLGFGVLRPRFSIRDAGEDQGRLCSASTCVNLLKLPRYKDPKILREKLLYSVNSNAGFDLS